MTFEKIEQNNPVIPLDFSVVIPIFNEKENISELYERLSSTLRSLGSYEIIFIDDGSIDGSFQLMKNFAQKDKSVKVIRFSRNYGQHPAIKAGFRHAIGSYIILMDADLQDDPEDIKILDAKIKEGYDIVFSQIKNIERSIFKKMNSMVFHFVFSRVSGSRNPADIGTFRIFTRKVLISLNKYEERGIIYGPLMASIGYKSAYVDVRKNKRRKGVTHYSFYKLMRMALDSLSTYTMIPLQLMIYSGFLIATVSFSAAIYLIFKKLAYGIAVPGYASSLISSFFLGGVILLSLGVIGDYIFRIYQEVLRRPLFLIDEKINMDDSHGGEDEKPQSGSS